MAFSRNYSPAFQVDLVTYVTVDLGLYLDLADRPQPPKYSRLWSRFQYPVTPVGVLLWRDGTVKVVDTFLTDETLTADDIILGGHDWYTRDNSWQADVLRAAGYTLTAHEGPNA